MAMNAVVTGASRGIGKAISLELAQAGFNLVVTGRTETPHKVLPGTISETADQIRALGRQAVPVRADLTRPDDRMRLVEEAIAAYGQIDVLVNNAAYTGRQAFLSIWDLPDESWEHQIMLNLTAPYLLTRAFALHMRQHSGGRILNLTSGAAQFHEDESRLPGNGGLHAAYATSKAALDRMTLALAKELRRYQIAIINLDPGATRTEIVDLMPEDSGVDRSIFGPIAVPARALGFLATCDDPLAYTGQVIEAAALVAEHNLG